MKRILITGARAPVSIDLSRRLQAAGHEVFVCDSIRFPIGRFTNQQQSFHRVASPRHDTASFIDELNQIIDEHKIDLLIPTSEESFYVSAYQEQLHCRSLIDSLPLLESLHNKYTFSQTYENEFASTPRTDLITAAHQLHMFTPQSTQFVFKPVYSRFASSTLVGPSAQRLSRLEFTSAQSWVAQEKVEGTEVSSFSLANNGKLLAHASYTTLETFLRQTNFTGQIGFDFIVDSDDHPWVIECNPRATSGIHLFATDGKLIEAYLSVLESPADAVDQRRDEYADYVPMQTDVRMIGAAMPFWGALQGILRLKPSKFIQDFRAAKDVLTSKDDRSPLFYLPLTMAELSFRSLLKLQSLQATSTEDMEWNGETLAQKND